MPSYEYCTEHVRDQHFPLALRAMYGEDILAKGHRLEFALHHHRCWSNLQFIREKSHDGVVSVIASIRE